MKYTLFPSIGLTICGIVFLTLVLIVAFLKKKFNNIENKIFRFIMIFTYFLLFLEVTCVITMYNREKIPILNEILCRTYILGTVVFVSTFALYMSTLGTTKENSKRKIKIPITVIIVIADIILFTISCFLPITYTSGPDNELFVIAGPSVFLVYVASFIFVAIAIVLLLRNKRNIPIGQRLPLYFVFITFGVITLAQQFWMDVNDLTFLLSFFVVAMYFTIESQDGKILVELEKSKEKAEQSDKAKTEFLSNMSHEIRTPLNTILGFSTSLLREKNLSQDIVKKDVKNIKDASINLLDLINNILDISKIESNKEELLEKDYDLEALIFEVNSIISSKINKDVLSFDIKVNENIPRKYYGDDRKIVKILNSVLINAIKYTNCGNITLDINAKKIDNEKYILEFLIKNAGHAMKDEDFEKDFNDFVKLDNSKENNIDSVTLGLIIAKRLISMLNGNIDFKNETGKGTRYYINIPQKSIGDEKIGNLFEDYKKKSLNEEKMLNLTGKKILIVDDNNVNIKLAKRFLDKYNFEIDEASNGQECINLVKENKYDLIFLDHMMPELDGVSTMKILKKSGYVLPPVIALTANSYNGLKDYYISAGFSDYLSKPISFRELNKIINKYFDKND